MLRSQRKERCVLLSETLALRPYELFTLSQFWYSVVKFTVGHNWDRHSISPQNRISA